MPDLHEDEPVLPSAEPPTPRPVGPPEVEALHRIDELIGNREHLGPKSLGKVRGIVLDTLNAWHERTRDRQRLVAGGRPSPLPSELLESADGGEGIAAFVLSVEALDRLPVLMRDTVPPGGFLPAPPEEVRVASMRGRRNRARDHAVRNESEAADLRRQLAALTEERDNLDRQLADALADADRYANALTTLEQERDEARRQVVEQGAAAEEQADALRSEVARLSGLLDDAERVGQAEVDRLSRLLDGQQRATGTLREHLDAERARAERAEGLVVEANDANRPPVDSLAAVYDRLREFVRNLAAEDWSDRPVGWLVARPRKVAASIEELVFGERVDPAPSIEDAPGAPVREETSPHPIAEDPRRPSLDHYPEDAILLTYREVRQLVGLHLEACGSAAAPADSARAMREGETPLRLAEVLDR